MAHQLTVKRLLREQQRRRRWSGGSRTPGGSPRNGGRQRRLLRVFVDAGACQHVIEVVVAVCRCCCLRRLLLTPCCLWLWLRGLCSRTCHTIPLQSEIRNRSLYERMVSISEQAQQLPNSGSALVSCSLSEQLRGANVLDRLPPTCVQNVLTALPFSHAASDMLAIS